MFPEKLHELVVNKLKKFNNIEHNIFNHLQLFLHLTSPF